MNTGCRKRFWLASEHLPRLLFVCCLHFRVQLSQDPETLTDLRSFRSPRFVDNTSHWSKILQLFSSESDMQKLQKKTHNIFEDAQQRVIPVVRARGRQDWKLESTVLKPADSRVGLARRCGRMAFSHSFTWDKNALPLCCLSGFLIPVTGKFNVKLLALEDMRCLGLESISGLGSFHVAGSSGNIGLDRMRGGAYILTEGQSLFVPYGFLPVIISLQSKENVDKGALLHNVHYSDANRHMLHKLDKQAILLYFGSAFAHSELSQGWKSGSPVGRDGLHAQCD